MNLIYYNHYNKEGSLLCLEQEEISPQNSNQS